MLAAAVLACRLVHSACQPLVPLVLHALPFNLHAHNGRILVSVYTSKKTPAIHRVRFDCRRPPAVRRPVFSTLTRNYNLDLGLRQNYS